MAEEENQELDEESLKERETVIMDIGKKFRDDGKAVELENMIKRIRPFTKLLSKAKAAKLIRGLVDMYLDMETGASKGRAEQAVELCKECIQWATEEKRIFLRQVRFGLVIESRKDLGRCEKEFGLELSISRSYPLSF